jgi:hypothetical protein
MFTVLLVALVVGCLAAPWWGVDTSDARNESAHPAQGWYPATPQH